MEHSIAAKYAARSAARFVRSTVRARQRRLGLRTSDAFSPAPDRTSVLQTADLGPLVAMRAAWRAIRPAPLRRRMTGPPRHLASITWARSGRSGAARRPSAALAPWRG